MKTEEYLHACLKDYTKLGDEIHCLKKENTALKEKLEQKDAIIRGLKRKAKLEEESHKYQANLATLQAAIKYTSGYGGKKGEAERLQALVAGRQAARPLPRSPNPSFDLLFEGEENEIPSSPPTAGFIRHSKQQRDEEAVAKGPAHRLDNGGRRRLRAQPPSGPLRQQDQEYQKYRQQQQQMRQNHRRPHHPPQSRHQQEEEKPAAPHVDLCLAFLKSGKCAGCPRTHDPKEYPSWTKGYQSGLEHREDRDHSSRLEFENSAGLETATTALMGAGVAGSAGQKRARSNFGAWSASKHRRFETEERVQGKGGE
ncbi:hypothetical protein AOL_s00080g392 [Orbilia oligospora ATCC 24927]|uniref:Uncharacterized protein n=1 Tax=Arthrobotrys oligospora (strain ATCC 24927 / CBS 115.81 / DSM 1491) TaxID=756982 RepID=G1XF07_ARTOA|nr:hypothetical protein AOL_s00080g392 [Orbilia oligospora ATCC 24927]EGX48267.1 hypothetical protein AOL_s00080g392 [Orbilia oligospora ATCC 24927]